MQTVLEQGSVDKPLTFDVGLIQLSSIPVCSLNTCNISVKLCRGFALHCFSFILRICARRRYISKFTSERNVFSYSRDYQSLSNLQLITLVSVVWGLSVVGGIRGK